jgi:TusE/DsrC/DsvC family sulfur relay protein
MHKRAVRTMVEANSNVDREGFVKEPGLWSEALAVSMAEQQFGIEITEFHLRALKFIRDYFLKWGTMPMVRTIREQLKLSNEQLDDMFSAGTKSSRGIMCRLSGLPKALCIASGC